MADQREDTLVVGQFEIEVNGSHTGISRKGAKKDKQFFFAPLRETDPLPKK